MQIKMIVIQNRNNQSLWGKTTSWFKMFEINIIHNNHLDLACVCVCGQKRHTNDRLQVNRISRSTTEKHLWPQMTHKLYPQDDWFEMVTNNVVKNNMFWWRNMCKKHNIHNNHLDLMGVRVCGQKRHTQRIDCRPAKSHERLHVGTCGHRQETFNYIHHVTALRRIVIRTSKSAPQTTVLEQFHLHMCVSPQCQAIFPQ